MPVDADPDAPDEERAFPHKNEGIESGSAPSPRNGGRDPQYGTNPQGSRGLYSPKTVQGSTDEAPNVHGEQSTNRERDTLGSGRK
jgi:hypothetical protein